MNADLRSLRNKSVPHLTGGFTIDLRVKKPTRWVDYNCGRHTPPCAPNRIHNLYQQTRASARHEIIQQILIIKETEKVQRCNYTN